MEAMKSAPHTGPREAFQDIAAKNDEPNYRAFTHPIRQVLSISNQELDQMERHWQDERRAEKRKATLGKRRES